MCVCKFEHLERVTGRVLYDIVPRALTVFYCHSEFFFLLYFRTRRRKKNNPRRDGRKVLKELPAGIVKQALDRQVVGEGKGGIKEPLYTT